MTIDNRPGLHAKGVIEKLTDVDTFTFSTGGGNVSVRLDLPTFNSPDDGLRSIGNLNPTVKVFDASGKLLAQKVGPVTDPVAGLSMNFASLPAGTFFVQVGSFGDWGDAGQYSLTVNEDLGAKIVSSSFQTISPTQLGLLVTFNESISALTFTTADVRINGGAAGFGVVSVVPTTADSKTFLVTITKPTGVGPFSVGIGPDINDRFGNRMDQNQNRIREDAADAYFANYFGLLAPIATTNKLTAKVLVAR